MEREFYIVAGQPCGGVQPNGSACDEIQESRGPTKEVANERLEKWLEIVRWKLVEGVWLCPYCQPQEKV